MKILADSSQSDTVINSTKMKIQGLNDELTSTGQKLFFYWQQSRMVTSAILSAFKQTQALQIVQAAEQALFVGLRIKELWIAAATAFATPGGQAYGAFLVSQIIALGAVEASVIFAKIQAEKTQKQAESLRLARMRWR